MIVPYKECFFEKKSNVTWWELEIFTTCAQKHAFPLLVLLNSLVMWINGGEQWLHSERGPGGPVTMWWNSISPYKVHSIVFEKALEEPFSTWWNGISPYRVHSIVRKTTHPYHHANFCSTNCTMTMWSCQLWFLGHKLWTFASSNIVMFSLLSLKIEEQPHKSVDFHV